MFVDCVVNQIKKHGEEVCGDSYSFSRDENETLFVLSDGLGSGIKANILSTLTKVTISKMLAQSASIDDVMETLAGLLPVCRERKIAYATFSGLHFKSDGTLRILEFDNPLVMIFRDGVPLVIERNPVDKVKQNVFYSEVMLQHGDKVIVISDGVTNAGCGASYSSWGHDRVEIYLRDNLKNGADINDLVRNLSFYANELNNCIPADDITVAVMEVREKKLLNIAVGPPKDMSDDVKMANMFLGAQGKKIICGGTTANVIAKNLNKKLCVVQNSSDEKIPSKLKLDGMNMVTEGVVTLSMVLEKFDYVNANIYKEKSKTNLHDIFKVYKRNNIFQDIQEKIPEKIKYVPQNHVEELILELKNSDEINCFVGRAENEAYTKLKYSSDANKKLLIVEELCRKLESLNKKVNLAYF